MTDAHDATGGLGAGVARHAGKADRPGDASEQRQRHPEHRAEAKEFAPVDAAIDEAVDEMVFMLAAALSQQIEKLVVDRHVFPHCSFWC